MSALMVGGADILVEDAVQAYALWWREAGFHTPTQDDPLDWRANAAPPPAGQSALATAAAQPSRIIPALAPAPAATAMPDTLPAFLDWLASDQPQPETGWIGPRYLPSAVMHAPLMLIYDMPSDAPRDGDTPFTPAQETFLAGLLAAIGAQRDMVALAGLAMRRPTGGLLDETSLPALGARMRHYLALARPAAAILIGDRTSRALLGALPAPGAPQLPLIHYEAGTLSAISLPALDLLMSRPAIKARSWHSLRLLNGVLH